ncbi:unnamed protein product [Protopolystoma xenopodis]|uniref:Tubulin/FtsZ GTPase domain-containing protein n=1 Tax=Protopolystoma xenopodis TaxID=117903 RepID=A0A448WNE5_9PLAT|nr:unnamed protein product [Protopolystoma xenopodis]
MRQCGVQLGNAFWELCCMEHGIRPDGRMCDEYVDEPSQTNAVESFFQVTPKNNYVPRAILLDSEPSVIGKLNEASYANCINYTR